MTSSCRTGPSCGRPGWRSPVRCRNGSTGCASSSSAAASGVPSLVAAARGAQATAIDWAAEAVELLRANAARNGLSVTAERADWRAFGGAFDLALAADVLYEERNVEPLLELLPRLAPEVLLAEPGRPHAGAFLARAREAWLVEEAGERVYRLTRAVPGSPPARVHA